MSRYPALGAHCRTLAQAKADNPSRPKPAQAGCTALGAGASLCDAARVRTSPSRPQLHLETARLAMRPWLADDTSWHRDLVAERGNGKPSPQQDAAVIDGLLARTREHGVVPSVVVLKSTNTPIGYCGLIVGRASIHEPELAFELFERVHGNGYATEAATAVLEAAARSGRSRLWATVAPWNAPSFRVLEKLGFRRDRSEWDDQGEFVWSVLDLAAL